MSVPPEMVAFHIAFAVRDIDKAIERYRTMFGLDRWNTLVIGPLKIAYGGKLGFGTAIELVTPLETTDALSLEVAEFLDRHGEGIEHIGFWAPDVRGALESAVAAGGRVITTNFEQRGSTVVRVEVPVSATPEEYRNVGFLDDGMSFVRWELIGPPADSGLRGWLQEDFGALIKPPPWGDNQG